MKLNPHILAQALRGDASGHNALASGPGHGAADRSLSIEIDPTAPDGFIVHSFAGNRKHAALVPAVGDAGAKLGKPCKSTSEIAMGADE
jgi:hypothetical protein